MKRKALAVLMAAAILSTMILPVFGEEAEAPQRRKTVAIRTAQDFLDFAGNCTLDSWSSDKDIQLQADISLENQEFTGIATFGGSFDGNGHTISVYIGDSIAPAGLFRTLREDAVVKKLKVDGTVMPGGDAVSVGGIAGENYGTVENCAFTGTVSGEENTGGITGSNYGTLEKCKAAGTLTGTARTGGIAGYNEGVIDNCTSDMAINTESVDPAIDPTAINLDFNMDLSRLSTVNTVEAAADTGGIAGYSAGSIRNCTNRGTVGYPHIGYNLGGIAGRSCGYVSGCTNKGTIFGRKDVGGIVGQNEPNIATILSPDYLETLSEQFENLGNQVSAAGSHAAGAGNDIQSCIQTIAAYQSSARAALDGMISGVGDDLENFRLGASFDPDAIHNLGSAIQGMVTATRNLKTIVGDGVEDMSADVDAISGQISEISRTLALATEDAKEDTVTDLSDVGISGITAGRIKSGRNSGAVQADLNTGGIVGTMGVEYGVDPEDDMPSGSVTRRRSFELKDIASDCVNEGAVTGKRTYAGGICGRMELGLVTACENYGYISSESGDYVGGIAGMTGGTVRDSFAKCSLSGGSYIGGIVGSGIQEDYQGDSSTVADCRSMVRIDDYTQYIGAISGADIGSFTGNYFVSDNLQGINGVSYFALAEPVTYDKLLKLDGVPQAAKRFTLTLEAEDETLKTLSFAYGASFPADTYPELPQKEGYYARWSVESLENLRFDTTVTAEYLSYSTALPSADCREDGRPVFFVQGQFPEGAALTVSDGSEEFVLEQGQTLLETWHLPLPTDGTPESVRYIPDREGVSLHALDDGNWKKISTEEMGSYLRFDAEQTEIEIAVTAETFHTDLWFWAAGGAAVLAVVIVILLVRKRKKKLRK